MTITRLINYRNGNSFVNLFSDGTRTIEYDGDLKLEWPLNIDIRVSTQCSFGFNPKTGKAICDFCHESAQVDGSECDYEELKKVLEPLPIGIELAIGSNMVTPKLIDFLQWAEYRFICNLTVNQGHLQRDFNKLALILELELIKGLGISYREGMEPINNHFLQYPNTVVHVIAGLDDIDKVKELSKLGVRKLLVLGEKDFGFNCNRVDLQSPSHLKWYREIRPLLNYFTHVSFDNLALSQLGVKRFLKQDDWATFYQGEHSMYINAVTKTFAPSSRSLVTVSWDCGIQKFFLEKERNEHLLST